MRRSDGPVRQTPIFTPNRDTRIRGTIPTQGQRAQLHCLIKHTKFGPTHLFTSCRACPCNVPGPPQSSSMWPSHCAHPATMDSRDEPTRIFLSLAVPSWGHPSQPLQCTRETRNCHIYIYIYNAQYVSTMGTSWSKQSRA